MSVFIAISVVDTFSLIPQFEQSLYDITFYGLGTDHWKLSYYLATCKIMRWLESTSQICSGYFVLLFTLERFISVRYPLKRAIICTKRRITIAIGVIVVCAGLATVYELYYYELTKLRTISVYLSSIIKKLQ